MKFNVSTLDPKTAKSVQSVMTADSEPRLRMLLESRGQKVLSVEEAPAGLNRNLTIMKKRIKPKDVAVFSRTLATLVSADMQLSRALRTLANQTSKSNPELGSRVADLSERVDTGSSLSQALEHHPDVFPPLMISMVRTGESGGFLARSLTSIADTLEKSEKLRRDVKAAATYPVAVMIMGILAAAGMLMFILPIFADMFDDLGGELPLPTRIAMSLSVVLRWAAIPLAVGIVAFIFWWRKNKNKRYVREFVDPIYLKIPIMGPLMRKISVARFCRNMATMLEAQVPLVKSLETVAPTTNNVVVEAAVVNAARHVRQGAELASHLGDGDVIDAMVVDMVAAGEDGGDVGTMLGKAADFYEAEIEATTKSLASTLEPILIAVVGSLLGGIIVAMYMPIFKVFDLIQ